MHDLPLVFRNAAKVLMTGIICMADSQPGSGVFALSSLSDYNFNLSVGSSTFTNANLETPTNEILVARFARPIRTRLRAASLFTHS